MGYFIGFVFGRDADGGGMNGYGGVPRQPVSKDNRIPRPSWGPDLSMMDDEFL